MKFVPEADTGRWVRLDAVEVFIETREGVRAFWRNPDGDLQDISVNDWDFAPELLNATTVPAAPGHFVLEDMYGHAPVKRAAIVAWLVVGQQAFPVAVSSSNTVVDLHRKDRAVEFPDGHVELGGDGWSIEPQRFETVADFARSWPAIREKAKVARDGVSQRRELPANVVTPRP